MVYERRGSCLAIGARNSTPALRRKEPRKLRLPHNLTRMRTPRSKEVTELRDARARYTDIVATLHILGGVDKCGACRLKRTRTLIGGRLSSTIHSDGAHTLPQMAACPRDNVKTSRALAQHKKRECLRQWHGKNHYPNWKKIARPRAPKAAEIIQKRITTLVSAQPFFSK